MIVGVATEHVTTTKLAGRKVRPIFDLHILFNGEDVKKMKMVYRVCTGAPEDGGHEQGIYRYVLDENGHVKTIRNDRGQDLIEFEFVPGKVEVFLRLNEGDLRDVIQANTFKVARFKKHPADADPVAWNAIQAFVNPPALPFTDREQLGGVWDQFTKDFPGAANGGPARSGPGDADGVRSREWTAHCGRVNCHGHYVDEPCARAADRPQP